MSEKRQPEWIKLDYAAKIFPSTSSKHDTKVFRFYCELHEKIDQETLQAALDFTITRFSFYRSILKKGLFWYYFEDSVLEAKVSEESDAPCSELYNSDRKNLLFNVTYFGNRINLEVYHALCDGTGAMNFLKTLIASYLSKRYDDLGEIPLVDYDASTTQKKDDSFYKYYKEERLARKKKESAAHHLKGEKMLVGQLGVIEGTMSVTKLIELSHQYDATLSAFLTAVLIYSIGDGLAVRERNKPVVITVPVNLRNFFKSESARNFFGIINVGYNFSKQSGELEDIIENVRIYFKKELTAEKLGESITRMSALENAFAARIVPVALKDPILKIANFVVNRNITAAFSNIGRVTMPDNLRPYVKKFGVICSTNRLQACMCSYEDNFTINFSSPFISTDVQRYFFRTLTKMGIEVELTSNIGSDKK